jgi:hypothetical protein
MVADGWHIDHVRPDMFLDLMILNSYPNTQFKLQRPGFVRNFKTVQISQIQNQTPENDTHTAKRGTFRPLTD